METCSWTSCKSLKIRKFSKSEEHDGYKLSIRSAESSRNQSLEIHLPPRPGQHKPHPQPGRVRQLVLALASRKSPREVSARPGFLLSWLGFLPPLHRAVRHRHLADVLLPPRGAQRLSRHERSALRCLQWRLPSQSASLGRAFDGLCRVLAHVSRVLSRRIQTSARIQLGRRRRPAPGDAVLELHRLSSALGPARVLGRHGRHKHYLRNAFHRRQSPFPSARRKHRRRQRAAAFLCAPRRDSSACRISFDWHSFLARAEGWWVDGQAKGQRWTKVKFRQASAPTQRESRAASSLSPRRLPPRLSANLGRNL